MKAPLIITNLGIKAYIRTFTHVVSLSNMSAGPTMAWVEFYIGTLCPHIFQNRKQILILTWKLCQHIYVTLLKRKLCSQFLNCTAQSQAWADVQIVGCSLILRDVEGDKFEIFNPGLSASAWSQREFYQSFSRNRVRSMVQKFYHISPHKTKKTLGKQYIRSICSSQNT